MWTVILIVLIILSLPYLINYCIHNTKEGRLFDKVPGPTPVLVIGNILSFFNGPVSIFSNLRSLSTEFKSRYSLWAFSRRILNVYNPEDIEIVLTSQKHIKKSLLYDFLRPWLKDGLLTSTGEKWQKRRKILTPAFHFNILRQFCKIFDEQSSLLVEALMSQHRENEIDIIPHITRFTLHSICETAMGTTLSTNSSTINRYKKAVHDMGEFMLYIVVRPWLHLPFIFNQTARGKEQIKALSVLHNFTTNVIRDRRKSKTFAELKDESLKAAVNDDDHFKSSSKKLAMLDLLLLAESKGEIDEDGVKEEVDTFMFEGHDTIGMAQVFCLMALANNKEVQEKIVEELDQIFGDSDEPVTIGELNQMQYLERCIKESLRLYPSVPIFSRDLCEEVQLSQHLIPANTIFHVHIFDLHRCPEIYPAPEVFDPDRFLPENCAKRHPFAYIPFSAGPRNCIGQRYAMLQAKSMVSRILRNFVMEPVTKPEDIIFITDMVLRSKDPIYIKFIPRHSLRKI